MTQRTRQQLARSNCAALPAACARARRTGPAAGAVRPQLGAGSWRELMEAAGAHAMGGGATLPALDFYSRAFDPLRALYDPHVVPPRPGAAPLDSVSRCSALVRAVCAGCSETPSTLEGARRPPPAPRAAPRDARLPAASRVDATARPGREAPQEAGGGRLWRSRSRPRTGQPAGPRRARVQACGVAQVSAGRGGGRATQPRVGRVSGGRLLGGDGGPQGQGDGGDDASGVRWRPCGASWRLDREGQLGGWPGRAGRRSERRPGPGGVGWHAAAGRRAVEPDAWGRNDAPGGPGGRRRGARSGASKHRPSHRTGAVRAFWGAGRKVLALLDGAVARGSSCHSRARPTPTSRAERRGRAVGSKAVEWRTGGVACELLR